MSKSESIIRIENLKKHFPIKGGFFKTTVGHVKAVDGLTFDIKKGETFGLVGESGCGKSTTGRTMLRLLEPTDGAVYFKGENIFEYDKKKLRDLRTKMQIVFQDPYSSLNPRMTVGELVGEALLEHGLIKKSELESKVKDVVEKCGLSGYHIRRYPHEFSGGQRQRIGIARALALDPEFIVLDEAVSALDVSIQAQVINLLKKLQKEMNLTYLFISHDLSVVKYISDSIGVMYLGQLVEKASNTDLFDETLHPYSKALLSAVPQVDRKLRKQRQILEGDLPSPANPPAGCRFHTRCPIAEKRCTLEVPEFRELRPDHYVACHLAE